MLRCLLMVLLALALISCGDKSSNPASEEAGGSSSDATSSKSELSPELLDRIDPYRSLFVDLSIDEALGKAMEDSRLLVVYYHNEGCEHCRHFEEEVLSSDEVQDWLKENAVLIRNRTPNEANVLYQRYSDGAGLPFPSIIILRNNGDRLRVVRPDVELTITGEALLRNLKEVRALAR